MKLKYIVALVVTLAMALPMAAQMFGPKVPTLSGIWHPVVGTGAGYEMSRKDGQKTQMEITVVGKEDVAGKPAFWMEMGMTDPRSSQLLFVKTLMSVSDDGTESVTVPAGTFSCTHFRMKDGSGDAWVSDKVGPWGLVKSDNKDSSMVLTKVITDAKDHITGTPTKFDPMQMMRNRGAQQGQ